MISLVRVEGFYPITNISVSTLRVVYYLNVIAN